MEISSSPTAFVGGAERARRNAQKRKHRPPRYYDNSATSSKTNKRRGLESNQSIPPYPKSMREYDRFFGSLLSSSAAVLQKSEYCGNSHRTVMHLACSLLNIPLLSTPAYLQKNISSSGSNEARTHHLLQRSSSVHSNASGGSMSSAFSGSFDNARDYYMSMAPLVLEESRCIIAESLTNISHNKRDSYIFSLKLASVKEKYSNLASRQRHISPLVLDFQVIATESLGRKQQLNNDGSAKWTRPGSVWLLRRQQQHHSCDIKTSVLTCIVPSGNQRSESSSSSSFLSLMLFRREELNLEQLDTQNKNSDKPLFVATALTTLISQVRQIEACLRMVKVSFMRKLLGQKNATHIRFDNSSDDEEEGGENMVVCDADAGKNFQEGLSLDSEDTGIGTNTSSEDEIDVGAKDCNEGMSRLLESIPILNDTQERAAKAFLNSPKESLVLVQGPPGTGKSTFLVNVICHRLVNNPHARIMVSGPTNKAVIVLAERFLDVINSANVDVSAVLIGVEDKLLSQSSQKEATYLSADAMSSSLKSIFAYSWVESLIKDCRSLLTGLYSLYDAAPNEKSAANLYILVIFGEKIKSRISKGIPSRRSICACADSLLHHLKAAAAAKEWEGSIDDLQCGVYATQLEKATCMARDLIEALDDMDSPVQELLATARVIFCTLSTSGASIFKQTRGIDDLLIDEAAAATEPELCIPFHLHPQRMLAVGDPLQLPPTIMSRHAADMGLSRSMHQRLMSQCSSDHIMLDRQYRMHEEISSFPNNHFYQGKIANAREAHVGEEMTFPSMGTYSFINVTGKEYHMHGGSYANEEECLAICKLIQQIKKSPGWDSPNNLRIISFYQGQVTLLNSLLAQKGYGKVLVATVDSSQGCEANLVIISFVRSSTTKKGVLAAAGFLSDDRRINVALTRARHQLICVGDANGSLSREGSSTLKKLVSNAKRRGSLIYSKT